MTNDDTLSQLPAVSNPGYHLREIPRGEVGELSKILEEALEALDAEAQGSTIMTLVELSDLYGAMQAYLAKHHPTMTMDDLACFSTITQRAFTSGNRPPKEKS